MGIQINLTDEPPPSRRPSMLPEVNLPEVGPLSSAENKKKRFSQKRAQTLAYIDVNNVEQNAPENLHVTNVGLGYVDVTGFDLMEPKFMGMTPDQWREHKRNIASENEMLEMDMDY